MENFLSPTIFCIRYQFSTIKFSMPEDEKHAVVLFDGVCHLCDGAVRFIIKREKIAKLWFAPLQSDNGKFYLQKYGYPENYLDGLVLIENKRAYDRSSAVLLISRKLKFPWNLFFPLVIVPKPLRDLIYQWIACLRYRFFGKKEACTLPQVEDRARFL